MSWGPPPTRLRLLSSLRNCAVREKVRFLGCVTSYSTSLGCLEVEHAYPRGTHETARVDVRLVLETMGPECTRAGEWINVMGYVVGQEEGMPGRVTVQALVVWPTGALDIGRYERLLGSED